jgi:hypothetical protein
MGPFEDADWMPRGDWQSYEAYVGGWLSARFPGVRFEADVSLPGKRSGTARQIDILARGKKTVAIECKYIGRKIDVKCVEAFIGMLDDIGIEDGVIITSACR